MTPARKPYLSIPRHVAAQIDHYLGDELLTNDAFPFDPGAAASSFHADRSVLAVDIGGDKLRIAEGRFENGALSLEPAQVFQSKGGAGYLDRLESLAREADDRSLAVGISSATRLDGSVITRTVNLPVLMEEMIARHGADYRRLFRQESFVANDTVSGLCGVTTMLARQGVTIEDAVFVICASGLGAAVLHDGLATHVEIAHVPLDSRLNPLGQAVPCHVEGKDYVCVERVTAARSGIELLHRQQTGEDLDGVGIGKRYDEGEPLAVTLYETSAAALSHAIIGVLTRYGMTDRTPVVLHGGNFEIARYRVAVLTALDGIPGPRPAIVFARDLTPNACLAGAAIGASMQGV